jgi:hypothetical protein
VSGQKPFNGRSMHEIRYAHATVTPPPLDQVSAVPEPFARVVARALAKDRNERQATAGQLVAELRAALGAAGSTAAAASGASGQDGDTLWNVPRSPLFDAPTEVRRPGVESLRVALLYKRDARPDEDLLRELETALVVRGHEVFIDRYLSVGMEWASEIERRVRASDAVVPLMSAESITSEMLAHELRVASEAWTETGRPRLLPVRVNYEGPFPEEIAGVLDPLQYVLWTGPDDTPAVTSQIVGAVERPAEARPVIPRKELEPVGGAVPLDSRYYVVRPVDVEYRDAVARGLQQAREAGARIVLTDFQDLSAADLESADALFLTLGETIADQLDLDVVPQEVWKPGVGANRNFGRFIRQHVLERLTARVVWGLDEVDRLFSCDFGGEVFGLFRSWHNKRSLDPEGPWRHLTLAIAYATEAHLFITDVNQSPFNVGTRLALDDFTIDQVEELNRRHNSPLRTSAEVARLHSLVGGHPFLVRRSLNELAQGVTLADFEAQAGLDEGPLGDHLRRILVLLARDAALSDVVRGVLRGEPCPTAESFYRLRSAGIVSGDSAASARMRCRLYEVYLRRHLS